MEIRYRHLTATVPSNTQLESKGYGRGVQVVKSNTVDPSFIIFLFLSGMTVGTMGASLIISHTSVLLLIWVFFFLKEKQQSLDLAQKKPNNKQRIK